MYSSRTIRFLCLVLQGAHGPLRGLPDIRCLSTSLPKVSDAFTQRFVHGSFSGSMPRIPSMSRGKRNPDSRQYSRMTRLESVKKPP